MIDATNNFERLSLEQLAEKRELGTEFPVPYDSAPDVIEMRVTEAIIAANERLPVGAVYEIRGKSVPTGALGNYGRPLPGETDADRLRRRIANWGVAWYWSSPEPRGVGYYGGMDQEPLFRDPVSMAKENKLGGYLVIARLRVC